MVYERKTEKEFFCPLEYGLEIFGGKWKARIICTLATIDSMRYGTLKEEMINISDAVLSSMLKELMADKMIERQQFEEIPPRVEYSLTEKGKSIIPILQSIYDWSQIQTNYEIEVKIPACKKSKMTKKRSNL